MFNSVAYAADAAAPQANPLGAFLPLILIFVIFYFLLIRPQQKRQKQHGQMLDALKTGDSIVTNGGIYGTITTVIDKGTYMVEIASGVKVKMSRSGIAGKVDAAGKAEEEKK